MKESGLDQITLQVWSGLANTQFQVRVPGATAVNLELSEVAPFSAPRGSASNVPGVRIQSFSLAFAGPAQPFLPQGMYRFEHPQTGVFDLFIVPAGRTANGFQYHAVINRNVTT